MSKSEFTNMFTETMATEKGFELRAAKSKGVMSGLRRILHPDVASGSGPCPPGVDSGT